LGKLPIDAILPPGRHEIVVHSEGLPAQTKTIDIRTGQKVSLPVSFASNTLEQRSERVARENTEPVPRPVRPRTPRPEQTPAYRNKEEHDRAKDAAYNHFEEQWEARKDAVKHEKEYYDYQADHSEGAAKQKWKAKKDEADRRLDQLDDQKDSSKKALKKQWNDD
jgi:hypothetical protein